MKTEIIATITTEKTKTVKTLFKENIDNLYDWCFDSRVFLAENIKKLEKDNVLKDIKFRFPGLDITYWNNREHYSAHELISINWVELTKEQLKNYFNQESIDYCANLKKKMTSPLSIRKYLKSIVDNYGVAGNKNNSIIFKIDPTNIFKLNYDKDKNAKIHGIQSINNKYYLYIFWNENETIFFDAIDLEKAVGFNEEETILFSTKYDKEFVFDTENLRNMIVLLLLNQKLGI